ncbi:hypothetical protein GIB67_038614 [Kingdonia uniflora]|uniref:GDSL esterase/lipase 7 n=1 Tax=Kingdonia uniflora TaxID=39325 RepID=A0A7J7NPH7_9MAGN|nr:hypothetical protein GIB67_038614 [Kingdonia uniflora]
MFFFRPCIFREIRMKDYLILLHLTLLNYLHSAKSESSLAPALYVFGDSLLDSGNNNFLVTLARANFPPYGINFKDGATGRFTNGKTVADITAEKLGLPYAPPYLSPQSFQVLTGMNYASGAGGILAETGSHLGKCLSLDNQIHLFQKNVEMELPSHFGTTEELSKYLSKSIFMVAIGTNDYINNYLQPLFFNTSTVYTPQAFEQLLIQRLSQSLQRLYKLGARKIVVFEIGPIGCMPTYTKNQKPAGQCVEEYNQLVNYFNTQLAVMLPQLTSTSYGSFFINGKINKIVHNMIQNPCDYGENQVNSFYNLENSSQPSDNPLIAGFVETKDPCCFAWDGTLTCTPNVLPCHNIDGYFWWDAYHLTQAVYSVIARDCFNGSLACVPVNIQQLLHS